MLKTLVLLVIGLTTGLAVTDVHPFPSDDEWAAPFAKDANPAPAPAGRSAGQTQNARTDDGDMLSAIIGLPPAPDVEDYRLNPLDLIDVTVFQVPDLSAAQNIDDAGYIQLPLVGYIAVGGLTVKEAEQRIADELRRDYVQNPKVNVFVKKIEGAKFTVLGAVKKPGLFNITGPTTLLQGLAMAGGFAPSANKEKTVLIRTEKTGRAQPYIIDAEKVELAALADPVLAGGDKIVIPSSEVPFLLKDILGTLRQLVPFF